MSTTERTKLIGERVTATSEDGQQRLAGVLLPPADDGGPLRLHTDDDRLVDADEQLLLALIDRRPKGSRRMMHCPDGRPLYRHEDLPAQQLATMSMLKRARRRPAEGQEPIASYKTHRDYAPLYAIVDTAPLPPLPAGRQVAWETARTCARCGERRTDPTAKPYEKGTDGKRYCEACQEAAAEAHWFAQRAEGRTAAAEWAKGVLAAAQDDPGQVVLIHIGYPTISCIPIAAETWDGRLLVDAKVATDPRFHYSPLADVADQVRALQGRRLIDWRGEQRWIDALTEVLRTAGCGDISLQLADGDRAGWHWDEWTADRHPHLRPEASYRLGHGRALHQQQPPGWDREQLLGHIRQVVTTMATGRCYWWRATCQDPGCGKAPRFGTSAAANTWSERHHRETGHVISHTAEPGMSP